MFMFFSFILTAYSISSIFFCFPLFYLFGSKLLLLCIFFSKHWTSFVFLYFYLPFYCSFYLSSNIILNFSFEIVFLIQFLSSKYWQLSPLPPFCCIGLYSFLLPSFYILCFLFILFQKEVSFVFFSF